LEKKEDRYQNPRELMQNISDFFDILFHSEKLIHYGGWVVLLIVIYAETGIFLGFIFPGDALLFTAGILCGTKDLPVNIFFLLITLMSAAILGNLTGYITGKILGKKLFTKKDNWIFKKRHLETTHDLYEKYGGVSLIAGRFIWIVRTFVPILAGAIDMNFWHFNSFNIIGAVLWVGSLVTGGYFLGKEIPESAQNIEFIIAGITIVVMSVVIRGAIKMRKRKI
jgi:membrane-associated protein